MAISWTLMNNDGVVGELEEQQREMWSVSCKFRAGAAFEPLRADFAEKARLAQQLEDTDDQALSDRFDELEVRTAPPALVLLGPDGKQQEFGFLYIEGSRAGFRLV
jgi:hypothetical protein